MATERYDEGRAANELPLAERIRQLEAEVHDPEREAVRATIRPANVVARVLSAVFLMLALMLMGLLILQTGGCATIGDKGDRQQQLLQLALTIGLAHGLELLEPLERELVIGQLVQMGDITEQQAELLRRYYAGLEQGQTESARLEAERLGAAELHGPPATTE